MMTKRLKKSLLLLISLAMSLVLASAAVFAADTDTSSEPGPGDKASIVVKNVESGAKVTAYKIVNANYKMENNVSQGLTGYTSIKDSGGKAYISDVTNPTEAEIAKIVSDINGKKLELTSFDLTYDDKEKVYKKADVAAGMYLVLVSGTDKTIYNPMIVSAGYNAKSALVDGEVDADGKIHAKAKKQNKPTIVKTIVDPSSGKNKGDDLAIGDTQKFKISTAIPSYTEAYTNPVFTVEDTLSKGLKLTANSVVIKSGDGKTIPAKSEGNEYDNYTITKTDTSFKIAFTKEYIKSLKAAQSIEVTYEAVLQDGCNYNLIANTNEVQLTFSNNPGTGTDALETVKDKTYHYTFGIDAALGVKDEDKEIITKEIVKMGKVISQESQDGQTVTTSKPLAGATFQLTKTVLNDKNEYVNDTNPKHTYTATTKEDGTMSFVGLDAGRYVLKETAAPDGYSLNTKETIVVITAAYLDDGRLDKYTVTIDGKNTYVYKAVYDGNKTLTSATITVDQPVELPNTQIDELPSTGGVGTYLFLIIGIFVMTIAACMFVSRRHQTEDE